MTVSEILLSVLLTGIAVSYGWGMRGQIIGGEKGAMLPGALLGLFIAKLSGIPVIENNAFIFSAAGCLAMGYGGFEPYAQTMEMIICPKSDIFNLKRGYAGLMLKGANWFGICGTVLGMSFTAMTGAVYKWYEIVIIMLLIPFIQLLGIKIFNKPYDKENGVFPKIYFSRNSREEWGGNLLTLIALLIMTAVKGDVFSLLFGVAGIVSGAVGWAIAIWLYYITVLPRKNGKYIFGSLQKKRFIDNWKIMEFSLGLLGGGGLSLYFFLRLDYVKIVASEIEAGGMWNVLGEYDTTVAWIAFALAVSVIIQYFVKKLQDNRAMELVERAIYFSVILCLVLLGSVKMSELVVFLLIFWVALEKTIFDRVDACKGSMAIKIFCSVLAIAGFIGQLLLPDGYPMWAIMVMYTYFYVFIDSLYIISKPIRNKGERWSDRIRFAGFTYAWFIVLSTVSVIVACRLF